MAIDFADDVGLFVEALEARQDVGHLFLGHHQHQADAVVEGAEHLGFGDIAQVLKEAEDGGHGPGVGGAPPPGRTWAGCGADCRSGRRR